MNEFRTRSHAIVVVFILMRLFVKTTLIVASYLIIDRTANLEQTVLLTLPYELQIGMFAVITWILIAPLCLQNSEFITKKIVVGNEKISCYQGLLIKQSVVIDKKTIRGANIVQSAIGKRLGYGTIIIVADKTTAIENIKDPQRLHSAIQSL